MATRILKVDDEDIELITKLISNIHRRLHDDASHPVYSPYLLSVHRLHAQLEEGLLTEHQYVHALSNAKEAYEAAEEKSKTRRKQARQRKLQKSGITAKFETSEPVEPVEPVAKPKRTKAVKKRAAKKAAAKKPSKPKVVETCHIHQNSGARSPRSECEGCWDYYKFLHPDRYDAAWEKFNNKT